VKTENPENDEFENLDEFPLLAQGEGVVDDMFSKDEEMVFDMEFDFEKKVTDGKLNNVNNNNHFQRRKKTLKKEKITRMFVSNRKKTKDEKKDMIVKENIELKKRNIYRRIGHLIQVYKRVFSNPIASSLDYNGKAIFNPVTNEEFIPQNRFESDVINSINDAVEETGISQQLLMEMLNRDFTPEDYELLLLLDKSVAPKTVEEEKIQNLDSNVVNNLDDLNDLKEKSCCICMDDYGVGAKIKHLPCGHYFHDNCIGTWLTESSQNCPLDGLNVNGLLN